MRTRALLNRRPGSVSIEAILILPAIVGLLLIARVVSESFLLRADTGSDARQAVVAMADTGLCWPSKSDGVTRADLTRRISARCWREDAEQITRQEPPFRSAVEEAAQAAPFLLRDVAPEMRAERAFAEASGRAEFTSDVFLHQRDPMHSTQRRAWPSYDTWSEDAAPWRDGLDPAIWDEISAIGSASELFPRVFPAALR